MDCNTDEFQCLCDFWSSISRMSFSRPPPKDWSKLTVNGWSRNREPSDGGDVGTGNPSCGGSENECRYIEYWPLLDTESRAARALNQERWFDERVFLKEYTAWQVGCTLSSL